LGIGSVDIFGGSVNGNFIIPSYYQDKK